MVRIIDIPHFSGKKASTLLETLVALGILGLTMVAMNSFWSSINQQKKSNQLRAVHESLAASIASNLSDPQAIYFSTSLEENGTLLGCLLGVNTRFCAMPSAKVPSDYTSLVKFSLISPGSNTVRTPRYYDAQGNPCANNTGSQDPSCVFLAETFFFPICPNKELTCFQAEEFRFAYRIQQIKPHPSLKGATLPELPSSGKPQYIPHRTIEILGLYHNTACHFGSILEGFTPTGQPICTCRYPYRKRHQPPLEDKFGKPYCSKVPEADATCEAKQIFRGLKPDGTAYCVPYNDAFDCKTYTSLEKTCPSGYWLNHFKMAQCTYTCTIPGGGGKCEQTGVPLNDSSTEGGLTCKSQSYICCRFAARTIE